MKYLLQFQTVFKVHDLPPGILCFYQFPQKLNLDKNWYHTEYQLHTTSIRTISNMATNTSRVSLWCHILAWVRVVPSGWWVQAAVGRYLPWIFIWRLRRRIHLQAYTCCWQNAIHVVIGLRTLLPCSCLWGIVLNIVYPHILVCGPLHVQDRNGGLNLLTFEVFLTFLSAHLTNF